MRWFKADLHIHSVLSPCADLEMAPSAIVQRAMERGLDLIALTDHNSLLNTAVCRRLAQQAGLAFIAGAEVQTAEEIHMVCLFPDDDAVQLFQQRLYAVLPPLPNNPDFFGDQPIVDEQNNILGFEEKALINSVEWDLNQTVDEVRRLGGFCFPAHVDRATYSVLAQLGFVPSEPQFDALGITAGCDVGQFRAQHPELEGYCLVRNSDAHFLVDVGRGYTRFYLEKPELTEIILACRGQDGRQLRPDMPQS